MVHAVQHSHRVSIKHAAGGVHALRNGAHGPAVEHVQRLLNHHGAHLAVDGDFGPKTEAAVKRFQQAHHLSATGAIGHDTLQKLEGPSAHHKDELLRQGDNAPGVQQLERGLQKLGYDPGTVDPHYDASTAKAVAQFRHDEGLKKTHGATAGANLQRLVRREVGKLDHAPYHERVKHRPKLDAATSQAARATVDGIGAGSRKGVVANVQEHLRAAGFDPKKTAKQRGTWDERTTGAVKAFQKQAGLAETGRVNSDTWRQLKQSKQLTNRQTLGERSEDVKHTERLLQKLHMNPGAVDGVFDAHTKAAVERFERKHHLTVDGEVSPRDVQAMEKAARPKANLNTVRGCAQFLLHSKNVSFWSGLSTGSDRANVERLARGQKAFVPATGGHVTPTLQLMQSLVDMAKHGHSQINALTGGIHTPGSNHYSGHAVDLDVNVGNTAQIVRIANRHGGFRNFETDHIHLDF